MKIRRIAVITKWRLILILILVLLPCAAMAGYEVSLEEQLISVANSGDQERVNELLNQGVPVNAKDRNGRTAMMAAATGGHPETVKLLLKRGADLEAKDMRGETALMWSIWGGRLEVVQLLLDRGADPKTKTFTGGTPLMEAAARDHHIQDKRYFGLWPIFRALLRGSTLGPKYPDEVSDPQIVKLLLQKGADVNAKDQDGWTALTRAQKRGATEIVELLKAHGAKE